MTTTRTENDALIEALSDAQLAGELKPGGFYAFKHGDRVSTIDLLDRNLERPRRKKGTVVVKDAASFALYFKKHADEGSEVYVDIEAGRITAVLDAHEAEVDREFSMARWGEHRLILHLAPTTAWQAWKANDRNYFPQVTFAEFLEDNRADIRRPAAADMLEMAQHFQAHTKVTYASATVLASGDKRLIFTEETEAGAGAKQQIEVPSEFELALAPFDDSEPYAVKARFRYRIQGGALHMGYLLDNAEDVQKDAVKTVVDRLAEELGIQIMRGTPA
ncbi:hypothetical protein Ssi03_25570 [Sphaerisporangium siamense]|uniref:Uncharacterized protein YfdQ (DUF2303 family) n=1 Tax=Sphaerisporangium siamense TaxID=795645 RepID=A0A7W7G707_9ACTN|nr:DUF2303 family protein [Sphaerisporangium siamense]MBB4700118.1 uncharacterized protein YfdQ (DUF2303 family) [Sphaerisporangium siamense]GII84567.1 hypothetical protein Ssi03_25570 [Sphaerisporangium siamense]